MDPKQVILALKGPNVYGFLKGEAGSHKLVLRPEDSDGAAPFQTAVVAVQSLEEEESPAAFLEAEAEKAAAEAAGSRPKPAVVPEVVRIYSVDGDRFVRDTRTGVRTNRVREVFEGDLDELILAYLKTAEAEDAWE
jgi:protein subunit release factor B